MSVARFIKTGTSLMSGQGIQVINATIAAAAVYLRITAVAIMANGSTFSSAAQYLGTLNFGLHNFANNHVAIAYNRGDMEEVNVIQATSFPSSWL